ncbi:MAG: hypothetical protein HKN16_05505 [Saprospiraceae bacterium]|nr:hypothetical protein [Saprospiraceae bacterium]
MRWILFISMLFFAGMAEAQDEPIRWELKLSTDSLLLGNVLKVSFKLHNAQGRNFQAPAFSGFQLIGGPNQSSSMSIVNGTVSRESSYSFFLQPLEEGVFFIDPGIIQVGEKFLETPPLEVIVFPNPDGVEQTVPQENLNWESLPWQKPPGPKEKKKKKRKIYRI